MKPSNVFLILKALWHLERERGQGCTTPAIVEWLLENNFDPPPPRAIAQVCGSLPGVVVQGQRRSAYVVWRKGPLLEDVLRALDPKFDTPKAPRKRAGREHPGGGGGDVVPDLRSLSRLADLEAKEVARKAAANEAARPAAGKDKQHPALEPLDE